MINCPAPWNHLFIQASGRMYPCCEYEMESDGYDVGRAGNSVTEGLNSINYTRTRKLMMENKWPRECRACEQNEKLGIPSKRNFMLNLSDNRNFDITVATKATMPDGFEPTPRITSMFLELGNLCNLECPSCGPQSSTRWYGLNKKLNKKYNLGLDESRVVSFHTYII